MQPHLFNQTCLPLGSEYMQFYYLFLVNVGHTLHPTSSRGTHIELPYPLTKRNVTYWIRICTNGNATFSNTDVYCKFTFVLWKIKGHQWIMLQICQYSAMYVSVELPTITWLGVSIGVVARTLS